MSNKEKLLQNKTNYEGKLFPTNYDGEVLVLEYKNSKDILIQFINTGHTKHIQLTNLLKGLVKDDSKKFTHNLDGIVYGDDVGRSETLEYSRWMGMLKRCYKEDNLKLRPTYTNCNISDNFKEFPYFKEWCNKQVGFNSVDDKGRPFHLDKDLLVRGNKTYSEDTCCFIPSEINSILTHKSSDRYLPTGVILNDNKKRYIACIQKNGSSLKLGTYDTPEDAFKVYKQAKEEHLKELANKWKDKIDTKAYDALINYEVRSD